MRPIASSPRIFTQTYQASSDAGPSERCPLAVHRPSACSGVKALRNTSDARGQAAKLRSRFGPLTPSARSGNLIAGDGTKNGLPAPNKELTANPKQPLDRKSPIQVGNEPGGRLGQGGRIVGRTRQLPLRRPPSIDQVEPDPAEMAQRYGAETPVLD
jgi:hypothetical protein